MRLDDRPLNPVEVENLIRDISNRIAKGVKVVSDRYGIYLEADREYDRAYASAYLAAEGSIKDREHKATLECIAQRQVRDVAEVAYKHADRLAKALELELRAIQSIGASVRQMYAVAGRGEGA